MPRSKHAEISLGIALLLSTSQAHSDPLKPRDIIMVATGVLSLGLIGTTIYSIFSKDRQTERPLDGVPNYNIDPRSREAILLRKLSALNPDVALHDDIGTITPRVVRNYLREFENKVPLNTRTPLSVALAAELTEIRDNPAPIGFLGGSELNAHASYYLVSSPSRSIIETNGTDPYNETSGTLNPLASGREGLIPAEGGTGWLGVNARGRVTSWLSYEVEPLFRAVTRSTPFSEQSQILLQRGYVKVHARELEVELGRDAIDWGFARSGGMQFSGNAEPFTLISVGNSESIVLPSYLSLLGPARTQIFFTQLDEKREFPGSILSGIKATFLPHPRWEFGLSQVIQFGGRGADSSALVALIGQNLASSKENRNFSVDSRVKIPELGIEPYVELMWEDCCRFPPLNEDDTLHVLGLFIPKVDEWGTFDLALEWVRTNWKTYRHFQYVSGMFYRGRGIGHPLGPDGNGVYAILRHFSSPTLFGSVVAGFESRGHPTDTTKPNENRYRAQGEVSWQLMKHLALGAEAGYERTQSFDREEGRNLNNYLLGVSLRTK